MVLDCTHINDDIFAAVLSRYFLSSRNQAPVLWSRKTQYEDYLTSKSRIAIKCIDEKVTFRVWTGQSTQQDSCPCLMIGYARQVTLCETICVGVLV